MELVGFYRPRNKQYILPYKTLKYRFFITEEENVYCAVLKQSFYNTGTFRLEKVNERFYTRNSVVCI